MIIYSAGGADISIYVILTGSSPRTWGTLYAPTRRTTVIGFPGGLPQKDLPRTSQS